MVILLTRWIFGLGLPGSPGEDEPAVEGGSAMFAATAELDPKGMGRTLNDIAQANIFIGDETWKAGAVGLGFAFGLFFRHGLYLLIT
jgi:hypothetical protein